MDEKRQVAQRNIILSSLGLVPPPAKTFSGESERRLPRPEAYPVNSTEHRLLLDDPPLELEFPGEIHQHESDQKGDNALAGQHQHHDTGKDEDDAGEVFEHQAKEAKRCISLRQALQGFSAAGEIVRGDVDHQHGNGHDGSQKYYDREHSDQPERSLVNAEKINYYCGSIEQVFLHYQSIRRSLPRFGEEQFLYPVFNVPRRLVNWAIWLCSSRMIMLILSRPYFSGTMSLSPR